ncbi:hypothetical protein EZV62_017217 [Acer yangbiense]|uniref:Uncharacterized protein n=1 Tax=Acer yangbiense TaxID=1000413 RepID=A0A5C7HFX5_9ROSI|nr:hypothetical protein EZV62_017217 [Acer yangbiense]
MFPEVLSVRFDVTPFELGGKISTSLLSSMTTYTAYLVFADVIMAKIELFIYIECTKTETIFPKKRADGWLESELGEFFNGGDEEGELLMSMKTCWKEHLLVQGIEIRPKKE